MKIKADSPEEYLEKVPQDRKESLKTVREAVKESVADGFEETIQYDMISYVIPLDTYPNTYNKQPLALISIGNQKNYMALYMNNIYSDPELRDWFVDEYKKTGKKLDMGKSCVRFKSLDQLPLELIKETVSKTSVNDFIEMYEQSRA